MTQETIGQDPFSGHLFVFRNRRADRVKILYWDLDGFAIWYKRLEKGTFLFPPSDYDKCCISIDSVNLALILEGIDISRIRRQKRYKKSNPAQDNA
jgi:transposase